MSNYPYNYYVDIVTKRYFHGVDHYMMDCVMDCFHQDAVLTEMTSSTVHEGYAAIKEMFAGLFDAHTRIWHGNFVHTADVESQSICSQFTVEVTEKETGNALRYENCNRFYLDDGKFKRVFVYMSGENLLK
ncbi:MAG: nuclear transport factor 2 family protein [Gammaproteobacteria bacterium]